MVFTAEENILTLFSQIKLSLSLVGLYQPPKKDAPKESALSASDANTANKSLNPPYASKTIIYNVETTSLEIKA